MGNEASGGFGILNSTPYKITCGCSMGATYYYDNDIMPGKIFYRWPGAVHMTLFAQPTTDNTRYTDGKCVWECIKVSGSSLAVAAITIATLGTAIPALLGPAGGLVAISAVGAGGGVSAIAAATGFTASQVALVVYGTGIVAGAAVEGKAVY